MALRTATETASLFWHTLRYLKPIQFFGRVRFKVRPRLETSSIATIARAPAGQWQPPVSRPSSLIGPDQFVLLGQRYELPPIGGWDDDALDKLRRYNLHYFDDLCALPSNGKVAWHSALITRWIEENAPRIGTGWEPYPTSLRIVNWIKWLLCAHEPPPMMLDSLALQARWLARRLEWHLLGNHLFANAKALVFAGMFFQGEEADRWRCLGLSIIQQQLAEQLLPDGGHFERSPMYHAIFVEDILDLINAAGLWQGTIAPHMIDAWRAASARMLRFLACMTHPDGEIALFNDAAIGIAANLGELRAYAQRVGLSAEMISTEGLTLLPDSGYARVAAGPAIAFLDVAEVGPDYLPGHAHADTLSFELSLRGRRVIVNGGTSEYGTGPVRLFERGTAAHSTVEIDGENSSEVWSGFRVARRARPFGLVVSSAATVEVACSHDGYQRLPGKPIHRRQWRFSDAGLTVEDQVTGRFGEAKARTILAPGITISAVSDLCYRLEEGGVAIAECCIRAGHPAWRLHHYAPRFGSRLETQCLEVAMENGSARVEFNWL